MEFAGFFHGDWGDMWLNGWFFGGFVVGNGLNWYSFGVYRLIWVWTGCSRWAVEWLELEIGILFQPGNPAKPESREVFSGSDFATGKLRGGYFRGSVSVRRGSGDAGTATRIARLALRLSARVDVESVGGRLARTPSRSRLDGGGEDPPAYPGVPPTRDGRR